MVFQSIDRGVKIKAIAILLPVDDFAAPDLASADRGEYAPPQESRPGVGVEDVRSLPDQLFRLVPIQRLSGRVNIGDGPIRI